MRCQWEVHGRAREQGWTLFAFLLLVICAMLSERSHGSKKYGLVSCVLCDCLSRMSSECSKRNEKGYNQHLSAEMTPYIAECTMVTTRTCVTCISESMSMALARQGSCSQFTKIGWHRTTGSRAFDTQGHRGWTQLHTHWARSCLVCQSGFDHFGASVLSGCGQLVSGISEDLPELVSPFIKVML